MISIVFAEMAFHDIARFYGRAEGRFSVAGIEANDIQLRLS